MVDHPPAFQKPRRNITVIVAIWVLCLVAFLELILAGIALTPRLLAAARNSPSGTNAPSAPSASTATPVAAPTPPPTQVAQTPVSPQGAPPKTSDNPSDGMADAPLPPPASDTSLQGSSALGIVSVKLDGSDDNSRKLQITIKSNPRIPIDVPQVKIQVYFYDSDGSSITPSKAQVTSTWLSPPVDWKDREPELLEVRYLPDSADSDLKFAGYVVAIYYKGDLQDYRAEPSRLSKLFPVKYFIGSDE
jgi:hypothetical protein